MSLQRISRPVAMAASRQFAPMAQSSTRRTYATTKEPGPTSNFYKTFTRPVFKVLVLAVFTYQFVYWGWVKLETDEHKRTTEAEIADLEAKVSALDKARKTEAEAKTTEVPKKKSWW